MRKIVGILRPFDILQTIYVYEDNNKIDCAKINFKDLNDTIFELSSKYDIEEINFLGTKQFNKGIQNKLEAEEMTRYNKNKLKINLL